jgi:type I restriction enzyme S subunit
MEFEASFIDPLNLPIDWKVLGFPDLVFFQEGPGIRNWQYVERDGVRFVNIRCLEDGRLITSKMSQISKEEAYGKYSHFLLDADDYVVSSSGTLGRVATVQTEDLPCCLNTSVIRMRPANDGLERGYLKYFLLSDYYKSQIFAFANGSAQLNYGPTHLKQMEIIAPPVADQKAIAHILGTLDDKIELNRKTNETLEAMAKALFKSWFVDFDPVRAKAEGRPTGLPAEISDLFPDSFEDSELGEIPSGWRVGSLDQIGINPRETAKPEDMDSSDRYIGLEHMPRGSICLGESGQAEELESNKNRFRQGDLLFGKLRPYFKKTGYSQFDGVCSTDIVVVRKKGEYGVGFICCFLASDPFIDFTVAASSGTRMPRTSWKDMCEFPFAIPSKLLLCEFDKQFCHVINKITGNCIHSASLAVLRDALLPKLISGEIRIPDAEKMLEEVGV